MAKYIEEGNLEELNVAPEKIVVLDCETTGLDKDRDEILQISLIDGNGEVLLDTYLKPKNATSWPGAQAVHGITPDIVADAPDFSQYKKQVEQIIRGADLLIGYNLSFDLGFVRAAGVTTRRETKQFDVMKEYAPVHGEWASWKGEWKWAKLTECAAHYGFSFAAHNSLEDAKVTLKCFRAMLADKSPYGYMDLHDNPAKLNRNNLSLSDTIKTKSDSKKKHGCSLFVLIFFALGFLSTAFVYGYVGAGIIGAVLAVVAFLMIRKK